LYYTLSLSFFVTFIFSLCFQDSVPHRLCRETCEAVANNEACLELQSFGFPVPDCNQTDVVGEPIFPAGNCIFSFALEQSFCYLFLSLSRLLLLEFAYSTADSETVANQTFSLSCLQSITNTTPEPIDCPEHLVYSEQIGFCALKCPCTLATYMP
jgi:hypothetical protein